MKTICLSIFVILLLEEYLSSAKIISKKQTCAQIPTWLSYLFLSRKISHGDNALSPIPWQVSLRYENYHNYNRHYCGGTILDSTTILTAAHCNEWVYGNLGSLKIVAGTVFSNVSMSGQDGVQIREANFLYHPDYNSFEYDDIAILKLDKELNFNEYVQAACLPDPHMGENEALDDAIISGWGYTEHGHTTILKYGLVQTMNKKCRKLFSKYLTNSHVCAASLSTPSTNICGGDSGGPLVVDKDNSAVIYGITSYKHKGTCGAGYGGVFTRVSSYLPWIKSHMEPKPESECIEAAPCNGMDDCPNGLCLNFLQRCYCPNWG